MKQYIECKICGKKLKRITHSHVKTHNITIKQYQDKFGYDPSILTCESLLNKFSVTEKSMINKYGEKDGKHRWNEYKEKQRVSNTYEYKKHKHGWTMEQFNSYNSSRAVTKENCIKRHGKVKGLSVYNEYIRKQRYSGCTIEYFIDKYGEPDGIREYNRVCREKGHTIDNYIRKYGILSVKKYNEYKNNQRPFYSKISQEMFDEIYDSIEYTKCYYAKLNKEYGIYLPHSKQYTFIDFYVLDCNKAIEFYGDYWHCNPNIYDEKYVHTVYNKPAKEVWDSDNNRISELYNHYGIDTLVIWQQDYIDNKNDTINKCLEFLND